MPSRRKSLMFASAFLTSIGSFATVCVALATKSWVYSESTYTTTKLTITYGLFQGVCSTEYNGLSSPITYFEVTEVLETTILKSFNGVIIFLLVLILVSSFLSSGFTCYNAISNPYQTFLGPIGIYTWNSVSGICCLLNLILFAVNVEVNKLSAQLARQCKPTTEFKYSNTYGYSYWIMLLIIGLNAITIVIIVFYQHASYSKRKERERPLDTAPKDGILF